MSNWAGIGKLLAKITPEPMLDEAAIVEAQRLTGDYCDKMMEQAEAASAGNATALAIMATQAREAAKAASGGSGIMPGLIGPSFGNLANAVGGGGGGGISAALGTRVNPTHKAPEVPEWDSAAKAMELFAFEDYGVYGVKLNGDICELENMWNSEYECEIVNEHLTHTVSLEVACRSVGIINHAHLYTPEIIDLETIGFSLSLAQEFSSWPGYVVFREAHIDLTRRFIISRISGIQEQMVGKKNPAYAGKTDPYVPFDAGLISSSIARADKKSPGW